VIDHRSQPISPALQQQRRRNLPQAFPPDGIVFYSIDFVMLFS
jgi:hypothetical protein